MYKKISLALTAVLLCMACLFAACESHTETTATESTSPMPTAETAPIVTEPEPEFSETPQIGTTKIAVDGTFLRDSFLYNDTVYVSLTSLSDAFPVNCDTQIKIDADHTCTVNLQGRTLELCANAHSFSEDQAVTDLESEVIYDGTTWYLPANSLMTYLNFSALEDPDADAVYFTRFPRNTAIAEGKKVPVLMYHAVSDNCWGSSELFVSPSTLDAQIALLLENGYTLITFEDFDHLDEIEKPIMLTFDDGYDDNYTDLFPILQKYRVKATVFMITNDIGKNHKLTAEQITEMSNSGLVSIQSHTMSHEFLSNMNEEQLHTELSQSKLVLARLTGKEPFVLCYPTGKYSDLSLKVTKEYYEFGLLMSSGLYTTGGDPYLIRRYYVPRGLSASSLLYQLP